MEGLFSETAAAAREELQPPTDVASADGKDEPTKGVDPRVVPPTKERQTVSPFTTSLPTFPLWLVPP